jgi:hypothetical protein
MRAISASTFIIDPYRAGIALGESLASISPEVVFLFSSTHYCIPEFLEGLHDALELDEVIVIGNSGDGVYATAGSYDHGAAALGLNSYGRVRWQLEHFEALGDALESKFGQLIGRLAADGQTPRLGFLVSDFRIDASRIESLLGQQVNFPVVGGLATDNRQRVSGFVYINRTVVSDALVMLAAYGDLRFSIQVGNSQQTIGRSGLVDEIEVGQRYTIDGIGAMEFIERETGKPVLQTDRGILSVLIRDPQAFDEKRLRSIVQDFPSKPGLLGLFGAIGKGHAVQVCLARPADMIAEVKALALEARAGGCPPVAALVISCSGRKVVLGELVEKEVSALTDAFSADLPLAGFPSAGEIAPLRRGDGYTRSLFHNMTYVLLLIEPS